MVIPDCVISRWLNSSSSSSSNNRHWLASHDELITFNSDAVVMAVGIARCTQTAVSQPTFVCLTCSSEQYQLSTYPNNTTCFIHCMLLNHCVMTVFSLKKQMNEWMNEWVPQRGDLVIYRRIQITLKVNQLFPIWITNLENFTEEIHAQWFWLSAQRQSKHYTYTVIHTLTWLYNVRHRQTLYHIND